MFPQGWRRLPRLVAGLAMYAAAALYIGETPFGWTIAILGVAIFLTGTQGLCLACAIKGCKVGSPAEG